MIRFREFKFTDTPPLLSVASAIRGAAMIGVHSYSEAVVIA